MIDWNEFGVICVNGEVLGSSDMNVYLVMFVGYEGLIFFVYFNFRVIMCWNNLEFYVIVVG